MNPEAHAARLAKNENPNANGWLTVYFWDDPDSTEMVWDDGKQRLAPATHWIAVYFKDSLKLQRCFLRTVTCMERLDECMVNLRKGGHEWGNDITRIYAKP